MLNLLTRWPLPDAFDLSRCFRKVLTDYSATSGCIMEDNGSKKPQRKTKRGKSVIAQQRKSAYNLALGQKIATALVLAGRKPADLGRHCGVERMTVSYWISGRHGPAADLHQTIAAYFGQDQSTFFDVSKTIDGDLTPVELELRPGIDLISSALRSAQMLSRAGDEHEPQERPKRVRKVQSLEARHAGCVAFQIEGKIAQAATGKYEHGDVIIIDPNHPVEPDCHVLALVKDGTEAVFRKYAPVSADTHVGARLIAWSPTWPDIIMTAEDKISGVGVELLRKLV
jgi:transcriptional regulator with XRE-family HTH domain